MYTLGIPKRDYRRATQILDYESQPTIPYHANLQGDGFYMFTFPEADEYDFKEIVHLLKINGITTQYHGVDDGITGYKVKYKLTDATSWSSVTHSTTDHTDLDFVVSVGGTGTFEVKVSAITSTHSENVYTIPTSVTVS